MTLIARKAFCNPFTYHYLSRSYGIAAKRMKKQQSEKKIAKRLVQKIGIPIMRLR
ncbi:hypothetical protein H650_12860 [Enterobacter sp. R4-368]|nr:hypothetical protein H650_12860 [Enterobacter sp. R4-368]